MKPRLILAVAVLAALAVTTLILWPHPRTELPPDDPRPPVVLDQPSARATTQAVLIPAPVPAPVPPVPAHRPTVVPDAGLLASAPPARFPLLISLDGGSGSPVIYDINKEGLSAAVRSGIPEIKECFEQWARLQPGLSGKLKVNFTISSDDAGTGIVSAISLGDAGMGHPAMEGCVLQVFQDLRFEDPKGEIKVTYPIVLVSADAG